MDFKTTRYRLTDIADVQRAKNGAIYPRGTIYIQVSATHGQIEMLRTDGTIETKYAVITPKIDIFPPYFKVALERCVPEFLARYQSTINIQMADFAFFEIDLHEDKKTQIEICAIMEQCDKAADAEEQIIERLKTVKKIALAKMIC